MKSRTDISLSEMHETIDTTKHVRGWKRVLSFFGPAYLVSVGYMDPGNWATDLAGGSMFGYKLIWVLLLSNLMALLLQGLSARLGIVRGRDLAQANREVYPSIVNVPLYALAEVAIIACDLAEVLGMAIGIHLLTGVSLVWGVLITSVDTLLLLFLQRLGVRKMEAFIVGLILIIGFSFLVEIVLAKPNIGEVVKGFVPSLPNSGALYIAIGIIGATVMPHNLYLHSALVQTRKIKRDYVGIKKALRLSTIDSTIALNLAFFVNAAILILAATVFYKTGRTDVAEIKEAHHLLDELLGSVAPTLFAIALIAAGQSSTITGTLAGQIVMEGYLRLRINPWMRRLLTRLLAIVPATCVILYYGEGKVDSLLIFSQVVLSLQLSFAIIPLIHFVSNRKQMGSFTIKPFTKVLAWLIALLLVYLNSKMVLEATVGYWQQGPHWVIKLSIITGCGVYVLLLLLVLFTPWVQKRYATNIHMHTRTHSLEHLHSPTFKKIAVALDFSLNDEQLLGFALAHCQPSSSTLLLIHIVESPAALALGVAADDFEARSDGDRLTEYVQRLKAKGYSAKGVLGFKHRNKEIVRIVHEEHADLLILGAHRHSGWKDWLYGATIDAVRHRVDIPVVIVNV